MHESAQTGGTRRIKGDQLSLVGESNLPQKGNGHVNSEAEEHHDHGPDHPITIERNRNRVVVKVAGPVSRRPRDALPWRGGGVKGGYEPVFLYSRARTST